MTFIARATGTEARAILQSRDPSELKDIHKSGVAATIWHRKPAPDFAAWINAVPPEKLPKLRTLISVEAVETCVHAACDLSGTPAGPHRDMLASDIAALGFIMGEVMGTQALHLRLDVVDTNACRRFHVDNMMARMLCTYRGTGTQLAFVGKESTPIETTVGSVLLLRGARWPGTEETKLLHRSPPIEGSGETRLLVVLDPALDHAQYEASHVIERDIQG